MKRSLNLAMWRRQIVASIKAVSMKRLLNLAGGAALILGLLYSAFLMLRLTLPYTAFRPGIEFLSSKVRVYGILHWRWSFYTHIFTALAALLAGATQFSPWLLRRRPKVHRIMGYVYTVDVLFVTGPAALVMSYYANGGLPAKISFILQSLCWLLFTWIALRRAFQRKFVSHGEWMLRSYALTFAAITLRLYNALLDALGSTLHPVDRYVLISWTSWTVNLVLAELLIRNGLIRRMLRL